MSEKDWSGDWKPVEVAKELEGVCPKTPPLYLVPLCQVGPMDREDMGYTDEDFCDDCAGRIPRHHAAVKIRYPSQRHMLDAYGERRFRDE